MKKSIIICFLAATMTLNSQSIECGFDDNTFDGAAANSLAWCEDVNVHLQNSPYGTNSVPKKIVSVFVHVVQDDDGLNNYQDDIVDRQKLQELFDRCNYFLKNVHMQSPIGACSTESIVDSKIQLQISNIEFYQNTDDWCTDTKCNSLPIYNKYYVNNMDISSEDKNENLHVIILGVRGERGVIWTYPDGSVNRESCDIDDDGCHNPSYKNGGVGYLYAPVVRGLYFSHVDRAAALLLHEIGHSFGLRHSFASSGRCCDVNPTKYQTNNFMDYGGQNKRCFTECQMRIMHFNLEEKYKDRLAASLCVKQQTTIDIPENEHIIWEHSETLSEDVNIYGELAITCSVQIAENVQINVHPGGKLLIDGGHLSSFCESKWKGIRVYGDGDNDYDVEIINGSIIENTSSAAVSMMPPIPWPEMKEYGNGSLYAENSIFDDCKRMVELIAFKPTFNITRIINCVQYGGKLGVTNWNCQGVGIFDNEFSNLSGRCILAESGSFEISGNTFDGAKQDILFASVNSGLPSSIKNNVFYNNSHGVMQIGTDLGVNEIVNNEFYSNYVGVSMRGLNKYEVAKNMMYGLVSVFSDNAGNYVNQVNSNSFLNYLACLYYVGDNSENSFLGNCFDSRIEDVHIDGSVAKFISGVGGFSPANNCFAEGASHGNIQGAPNPFTYIEPDDKENDCRDALRTHSNVTREFLGNAEMPECGNSSLVEYCDYPNNVEVLVDAINSLTEELNSKSKNTMEYQIVDHCLKKVVSQLFVLYINNKEFELARNLHYGLKELESYSVILSSYIHENDLGGAMDYLDGLDLISIEELDFGTVQNYQLVRLVNGPEYLFSAEELEEIRIIAQKYHKISGLAMALLFHQTGELQEIVFEGIEPPQPLGRVGIKVELISAISIFPNPFSDLIDVSIEEDSNKEPLLVKVFNVRGRLMFEYEPFMEGALNIPTNDWKEGLYLVRIESSRGEKVLEEKIMLIR